MREIAALRSAQMGAMQQRREWKPILPKYFIFRSYFGLSGMILLISAHSWE